jgi:outer membrane protein OmpA-like peptidoglycan-associated protein
MNQKLKYALGAAVLFLAVQASAQVTFYEGEGFTGRQLTIDQTIPNLEREGFNDGAASAVVGRGRWEVCEDVRFGGRCMVLSHGEYGSLRSLGMNNSISSVRAVELRPVEVAVPAQPPQGTGPITFYAGEGFHGPAFATDRMVGNFERYGFNDRSSSVIIETGLWEVCEEPRFEGRCVVLRPGRYDSLRSLGMDNRISSVRPADEGRRYRNERPEPPVEAPPPRRFERVTLSANELFDFDSATLRMPQPKIDQIARALERNTQITDLHITGYTDRLGSAAYNQKLSQRRANAVKAYLVSKGIEADRLIAEGMGKASPVVQCNQTKRAELIECLEPNRRIEIEEITVKRRRR